MTWPEALFLVVAGVAGGLTGSIAGLASVSTYPALLMVGLPPVTALLDTAVGAQARHMLTHTIVGDATQVAEGLRQFASLAGADEVMLTNPAPALDLRLHALEILADIHTDGD